MKEETDKIWEPGFVNLMLESIGDGVFTLNEDGTITSWNPSMERITGYKPAEAIGQSCRLIEFSRCFGRDCPEGIKECGVAQHGNVEPLECSLKHKSGSEIPVIKSARVMNKPDGAFVGIVETITDLKELKETKRAADEAYQRLGELYRLDNIIGKSHAMGEVFTCIRAAARSDTTVLIQGESGTGKEIIAGSIHYNSLRIKKPMVVVNCSALSESLLESELFGHVKGAFTGANYDRVGRFEEADGGTIFLDEIGEISPLIQVKLLRVIQEQEIERVGESRRRKIDLRLITATNKDLYQLTQEGKFREDLYYRLKVFPIFVPPLRARKEDIPLLVDHFIGIHNKKAGKQIKGLDMDTLRAFMNYDWPGNVRELEHAIEHAFVICPSDTITLADIPIEIIQKPRRPGEQVRTSPNTPAPVVQKEALDRDRLIGILTESEWNKAEVARRIGLSRASVWKYMKKWDIPMDRPKTIENQ